jgi:hypothetical protein
MGIKNAECDVDFESVEKVAKKRMRKVINNKLTEKWRFLLCAIVFRP